MQLSELKAKSMTYVFNNYKIRKILSVNRKRESTLKTVERLKEKITRWRQFTRTTLVNKRGPSMFEETGAIPRPEDESKLVEPSSPDKVSQIQEKQPDEAESPGLKTVKYAEEENEPISDKDSESDEEDAFVKEQKAKEQLRISPEEREMLHLTLATEFVRSKMGKQRVCVKFYLWLQNSFVERIIFKN